MQPAPAPPQKHRSYVLQAVVQHAGRSIDSGHYFAWGREEDGTWVKKSDTSVVVCAAEAVAASQAYICVYERFEEEG